MTSFRKFTRQSSALLAAGALAFGVAACDTDDGADTDVEAPADDPAMDDGTMDDGTMDDDPAMDDDAMDDDGMMDDDMDNG